MMRYSIRINLSDFIDTEDEQFILTYIKNIADEFKVELFLKLWYDKGEITQKQVTEFVKRNEVVLEQIGTNVHVGHGEGWQDKSWFNVCRTPATAEEKNYRHYVEYASKDEILSALVTFRQTIHDTLKMNARPHTVKQEDYTIFKREGTGRGPYKITVKKVIRQNATDKHVQK